MNNVISAIDAEWLADFLVTLVQTPTGVPAGATEIPPGDPAIVAAVHELLEPTLRDMDPDEVRGNAEGDLAVRFGPPRDDGLVIQTYVVSQHGNLTDDPNAGTVTDGAQYGLQGPCVVGQGANQNKGPMAAVFTAVRALPDRLHHPVWVTVNTEGSSSHGGSQRILDDLGVRASACIISIGTDLAVSIGNRGRVDVIVTVSGASSHSSQPWLGVNAIEGAADVVAALRTAPLPDPHPELGPASATPYLLSCYPVAPHTIPSSAQIVVDRRLLPGEEPDGAASSLYEHLVGTVEADLKVSADVFMLPNQIDEEQPLVLSLRSAVEEITGHQPTAFWSNNTFDAGYAASIGIATCMFGPGKRDFGDGVVATEVVSLEDCSVAAEALLKVCVSLCS